MAGAPKSTGKLDVYLEIGNKRVFAGAVDWPGWCRSGRDEGSALQALLDYGPRYARVLRSTGLRFQAPTELAAFGIAERLPGNSTTDFGAPDIPLKGDLRPVGEREIRRFEALLGACWHAFDRAAKAAEGKELRVGPRGGGRDLEGIVRHVLGGELSYLARLGWKLKLGDVEPRKALATIRLESLRALAAAAQGELPEKGPRGGLR